MSESVAVDTVETPTNSNKTAPTSATPAILSPGCKNLNLQTAPHIEIELVKCNNLAAKDRNGFSDPYVKFKIGEEKVKSSVHKKTLNPVYNEKFCIYFDSKRVNDGLTPDGNIIRALRIEVFDWDRLLSNRIIGAGGVNVSSLKPGIRMPLTLSLAPANSGTVELFLTARNTDWTTPVLKAENGEPIVLTIPNPLTEKRQVFLGTDTERRRSATETNSLEKRNIDNKSLIAAQASFEESNISAIGSHQDIALRVASAKTARVWKHAGDREGLEIWRIENFNVVSWPKSLYGKFYDGDSYIILNTYREARSGRLMYDVHSFLGLYSSADEIGTCAYKMVELDTLLGDAPVQFRNVQGSETDLFHSYFPQGITILNGGVASGFNAVNFKEALDGASPKLYWIQSKSKRLRIQQVPLETQSLNSGDSFLLDLGNKMIVWHGKNSSGLERFKSVSLGKEISSERAAAVPQFVISEGQYSNSSEETEFWSALSGTQEDIRDEESIATAHKVVDTQFEKKLYKVSDSSGALSFSLVAKGKIYPMLLDSNDVFLLDAGAEGIYIWIGSKSSHSERKHCMSYASLYMKQASIPIHTPLVRMTEGMNRKQFTSLLHWRNSVQL